MTRDESSENRTGASDAVLDERIFETSEEGMLCIIPRCPPEKFPDFALDKGIGNFSHYRSIIQKLDVFQKIAATEGGRVAVALIRGRVLVGYSACWHPSEGERWSKLGNLMYEMGAIEVSRNYRHLKLGRTLVNVLMEDDSFEDRIAYMNGYSWHWDLDGTGMTLGQYRKMIMGLLRPHGFKEVYTNEPNIGLREENFFMARIGSRVSDEDRARFRNLRFGLVNR
ncbi:MAG: N-acetyltransferase [Thermodesulfobacteriota bacterium]